MIGRKQSSRSEFLHKVLLPSGPPKSLVCPCAGLTGVLAAMCALTQRAAAPVNGLRSMNPYVRSTLTDWRSKGLSAVIPRQLAPGTDLNARHCIGEPLKLSHKPRIHCGKSPEPQPLGCI